MPVIIPQSTDIKWDWKLNIVDGLITYLMRIPQVYANIIQIVLFPSISEVPLSLTDVITYSF